MTLEGVSAMNNSGGQNFFFTGQANVCTPTARPNSCVEADEMITLEGSHVGKMRPRGLSESGDQTLRDYAGSLLAFAQHGDAADPHARLLEVAEREIITQAIHLTDGNQLQTAKPLGISRLTLRDRLGQSGRQAWPVAGKLSQ
jgi:DNA-binding NtrC family response regulator